MSTDNAKKTDKDKKAEPAKPTKPTPEAEATARINVLQEAIKALEGEVRTMAGRFKNRDPQVLAALQKENNQLRERAERLEKTVYTLLLEIQHPSLTDDLKIQHEVLKQGAIEYFKKANINPDLWKNIGS